MVYFTEVLHKPKDACLEPRVHARIVVCENALMCCFINPGLQLVFNLIYEQKYDSR